MGDALKVRGAYADNMSESTLISIAGLLTTLGAALGASWLTARASSKTAKEDWVEVRRERLRDALARTIVAFREWGTAKHTQNLFLAARSSREEMMRYLEESVDSWTANRLMETSTELTRALAQAKLLIADDEVLAALNEVEEYQRVAGGPILDLISDSFRKGEYVVPRAAAVLQLQDRYNDALHKLEDASRRLLAVKMES